MNLLCRWGQTPLQEAMASRFIDSAFRNTCDVDSSKKCHDVSPETGRALLWNFWHNGKLSLAKRTLPASCAMLQAGTRGLSCTWRTLYHKKNIPLINLRYQALFCAKLPICKMWCLYTPLNLFIQYAITRGDVDQIQRLINSKVDVNQGDYDSRTAIHLVNAEFLEQKKFNY